MLNSKSFIRGLVTKGKVKIALNFQQFGVFGVHAMRCQVGFSSAHCIFVIGKEIQ